MVFLADRWYRCIAHDRRGHGRSSQPWTGNDVDTYADDLAALVEELDLHDAIHVGHSTGAGRVRSEEHTSEPQSHVNLVCRLLLEKKKKNPDTQNTKRKKKRET